MILQFSAQIEEVKRNKDRTLRLKIDTQEIPPSESAHIFELQDKQIWIAFAETEITKENLNIPEVIDPLDSKSPSQRLRDRMFVYFKEKKVEGDFDSWYKTQLEKYGQKYLGYLN